MRTLKMTIAYRGTRYHGFQRQPNAATVQGELEQQLARVLNGPVTAYGCSRTDTGVHANMFVLHLHTEREIRCKNLVRALNGYLPDDISAQKPETQSQCASHIAHGENIDPDFPAFAV